MKLRTPLLASGLALLCTVGYGQQYRGTGLAEWKARTTPQFTTRERQRAIGAMGCLGRERMGWLTPSADSPEAPWVAREIVPTLVELLGDKDPMIRRDAACALRNVGTAAKDAIPALTKLLDDRQMPVRDAAVRALGDMGCAAEPSLPALVKTIREDASAGVRLNAARALRKIGPEGPKLLLPMLEDNRKEVRLAAISAIAFMYDEREVRAPVPVVLRLARDEDPEVRVNAVDLLFALRPRPAEAAALVPELLRDKAPRVRRNTVCALMSVKDSERYLPDLSNLVNDEDVYTRGGLAYVLGSIGAPAVPLLARLLDDKIANVRGDAADSLGKIGPAAKDAAPSLKRLLTDMGRVHDLQGCVCNHAGEALAKILHDGKYLEGLPPMPRDGP